MAKKWILLVAVAGLFTLATMGWGAFFRPFVFPEIGSAGILTWVIAVGSGSFIMLIFFGIIMYIGIMYPWKKKQFTLENELLRRAEMARTLVKQSLKSLEQVTLSDLGGQTDDAGNLYVLFHGGVGGLRIRGRSLIQPRFGRSRVLEVDVTPSDIGSVHPVKQEVPLRSGL